MTPAEPSVVLCALILDLLMGDPRWFPHPVVMIGHLITWLEKFLRQTVGNERIAGVILLIITISLTAGASWILLASARALHPIAGVVVAIFISYTCLSARSLHIESALVADALVSGDLESARHSLSRIVGRDTAELSPPEIWRALIETVAENTADGIIAPMFWLTIGGPAVAMGFKAVSTLDSMVGYRNERYLNFGWASARMDDLMNFIPARLTALLMILAAPLAGLSARSSIIVLLRDRMKHPSPNSGHPEAAAAGALGVQLGGPATYEGKPSWKELIGNPLQPLDEPAYRGMIKLMYITTLLMTAASIAAAYILGGYRATFI